MTEVRIPSHGDQLAATLSTPAGPGPHPVVVLGHGLGAVKAMGLKRYADRFTGAGFATLQFDYRGFGESGGTPRQWLDITRQLQDWRAVLDHVSSMEGIDPARIAIFGTSFGGGHAIRTAAADPRVAAAIAQCPFTDGIASTRALGVKSFAKTFPIVAHDVVMGRLGRPRGVPLAAEPGQAGLMTAPDAVPGYYGLLPAGIEFDDHVDGRIGLHVMHDYPGRAAARVRCPILFAVCEKDSVAPAKQTLNYAQQAPRGEVKLYPVGHFDIYQGEAFETAVADYVEFLRRHLIDGR